jgi:hypothetical protein
MRRRLALAATVFAAVITAVACSPAAPSATPSPTPPPDPQSLLASAVKAAYPSKLEITLGGSYTSGSSTTNLPDKLLTIDVDTSAGVGSVHLAVPTSLLGSDGAKTLAGLGVTGDTLSFDVLYDGQSLYAKSPIMPALLSQLALLGGATDLPTITADSWAMIVDAATMKEITSSASGAMESAAPSASAVAGDVKSMLDQIGATLTLGDQVTGPSGPANDVKLTIDPAKLKAYATAQASQLPTSQLSSIANLDSLSSLSADVLVDVATSRIVQVAVAAAGTQSGSAMSFALKVGIAEAPAGVSFTAPAGAVDVPLVKILGPLVSGLLSSGGLPGASSTP